MKRKQAKPVISRKTAIFLGGGVVLACICSAVFAYRAYHTQATRELKPRTLEELLFIPDKHLGRVDIARMNLLCATGLPGAENIDVEKYLATIDQWAKVVKAEEKKYLPVFYENRVKYEYSQAKFKAVYLGLTIQQVLKCRYNMELVNSGIEKDWASLRFHEDSRDTFIHGFVERKKGTCSSIPVLLVALGRRCGYPLYLVASKGHLFVRWEDDKDRFNFDAATQGVNIHSDEYFHTYPFPITESDWKHEKLLKNLSPVEELSEFMNTRGLCFAAHGKLKEAVDAYTLYFRGFPESRLVQRNIDNAKRRMNDEK